jgi:fumarate reductase flavoprotein subunit
MLFDRSIALILAVACIMFAAIVLDASAQTPAPGAAATPGAGHGFLIDKHLAAGLNCASCHANAAPPQAPADSVCTSCHGSYEQIAAKSASDNPNPHASHLGDIPCSSCHHIHQASVLYCAQCHNFDLKTP